MLNKNKNRSDFMTAAETMQQQLGAALCLAKWQQVSLHLGTGMTNSCYHPPLHKIDEQPLQFYPNRLHNTEYKKQQRKKMLAGERPDECSYCWSAEDNGQLSDRHYRSGEPWAADHFETVVNSTGDEDVTPSYVEVNFSNGCNLACSYCSPQYSTEWGKDIDRWGAYPTSTPHNAPEHFQGQRNPIPLREHNPYLEAFWKWWPELYPKLKHFRMTGGEPLMDRNTYRVLDYILAAPKPDLHVDVTSNFSVNSKLYNRYHSKVKQLCAGEQIEHFMQYVSVDTGNAAQAEYIRSGLDYQRLTANVHRFLKDIPGRNSVTFIITMNNLSLPGLTRLLAWILELRTLYSNTYQRVWFDTPLLRAPAWQSLQTLPSAYTMLLKDTISWMQANQINEQSDNFVGFKDYEIQRMERNLAWMEQGATVTQSVTEKHRADFYRFFNEYDKRRSLSFEQVFPEMKSFWQECKWHADQS